MVQYNSRAGRDRYSVGARKSSRVPDARGWTGAAKLMRVPGPLPATMKSGHRLTTPLKISRSSPRARLNPCFCPIALAACATVMLPARDTISLSCCRCTRVSMRLRSSLGTLPPAAIVGVPLSAATGSTCLVSNVCPAVSVTSPPPTVWTAWTSLDQLGTPFRRLSAIGCNSVLNAPLFLIRSALSCDSCTFSARLFAFSTRNLKRSSSLPSISPGAFSCRALWSSWLYAC